MRPFVLLAAALVTFSGSWNAAASDASSRSHRRLDWAVRVLREFRAEPIRAAVQNMTETFGARYPKGEAYSDKLTRLERQRLSLLVDFDPKDSAMQEAAIALADRLHQLRSEALLANPLLDFDRLLCVRRAYQLPPNRWSKGKPRSPKKSPWSYDERSEGDALGLPVNHNSIFSLRRSGYQNDIVVLSPARPNGKLTTLFRPEGDGFVGEVDLDFDAHRILFTMPEDDRWHVFELKADGTGLTRVTPNEDRDVDHYDACYLPDGRIVFCSTANYQAVPCWNGLHNVGSLYLLDRRSGRIRQLTFDQDDDNYPSVLNSGRVLYTRWEYAKHSSFLRPVALRDESGRDRAAGFVRHKFLLAERRVLRTRRAKSSDENRWNRLRPSW